MTERAVIEWRCGACKPGICSTPAEAEAGIVEWIPGVVPGTAASALEAAGLPFDLRNFDGEDWWYVATVDVDGPGSVDFAGLAVIADVWFDGVLVAHSESMYVPLVVEFDKLSTIAICFRSLDAALKTRRPRGRWRSSLVAAQGLRWFRATLLGRAPLFGGVPAPVGPWRSVKAVFLSPPTLTSSVSGAKGILHVSGKCRQSDSYHSQGAERPPQAQLLVGDHSFTIDGVLDGDMVSFDATVSVDDVSLWWPHTHGEPALYPVRLIYGSDEYDLGTVGFRSISVDRSGGGFSLSINDVPVFCRGACWVPPDPIGLNAGSAELRAALEQLRDAGMNMVRLTGTMVYETAEFWSLCAELGIMVWQDAMLATFDPPDTPEFSALIIAEIEALLGPLTGNPALIVLSGGSETEQQPVMLGLPADRRTMPVLDTVIPAVASNMVPAVVYVTSSPSAPPGTSLSPIDVSSGVAHYFGVGGYVRPLDDVRSAHVRFAAECLAFAIPPEPRSVDAFFGGAAVAGHDPKWKAAVPRDRGSSWDFEDVRDHYVRSIFGVEPFEVRRTDPDLYLDLGRAAVCEAVGAAFGFWRRADSGCGGAMVLTARDLEPGAGWGLVDSSGMPKAPWHTMRRVLAPIALVISDDGLDGIRLDVVNDSADAIDGSVTLSMISRNGQVIDTVTSGVAVPAHASYTSGAFEMLGTFMDASYAYRFGPAAIAAITAELRGVDGGERAETVYVPTGPLDRQNTIGLTASAAQAADGWTVTVAADYVARYVAVDVPGFSVEDSWFHLAPGVERRIWVRHDGGDLDARPIGRVRAVNSRTDAGIKLSV